MCKECRTTLFNVDSTRLFDVVDSTRLFDVVDSTRLFDVVDSTIDIVQCGQHNIVQCGQHNIVQLCGHAAQHCSMWTAQKLFNVDSTTFGSMWTANIVQCGQPNIVQYVCMTIFCDNLSLFAGSECYSTKPTIRVFKTSENDLRFFHPHRKCLVL